MGLAADIAHKQRQLAISLQEDYNKQRSKILTTRELTRQLGLKK